MICERARNSRVKESCTYRRSSEKKRKKECLCKVAWDEEKRFHRLVYTHQFSRNYLILYKSSFTRTTSYQTQSHYLLLFTPTQSACDTLSLLIPIFCIFNLTLFKYLLFLTKFRSYFFIIVFPFILIKVECV